jgi:hypothetical protein
MAAVDVDQQARLEEAFERIEETILPCIAMMLETLLDASAGVAETNPKALAAELADPCRRARGADPGGRALQPRPSGARRIQDGKRRRLGFRQDLGVKRRRRYSRPKAPPRTPPAPPCPSITLRAPLRRRLDDQPCSRQANRIASFTSSSLNEEGTRCPPEGWRR